MTAPKSELAWDRLSVCFGWWGGPTHPKHTESLAQAKSDGNLIKLSSRLNSLTINKVVIKI